MDQVPPLPSSHTYTGNQWGALGFRTLELQRWVTSLRFLVFLTGLEEVLDKMIDREALLLPTDPGMCWTRMRTWCYLLGTVPYTIPCPFTVDRYVPGPYGGLWLSGLEESEKLGTLWGLCAGPWSGCKA